jgi:hypothetical protein
MAGSGRMAQAATPTARTTTSVRFVRLKNWRVRDEADI